VSTSDLASLHLTRKAVKLVTQLGLDSQKVQVLINRMDKRNELNTSDLTKLFDCHVEAAIPNDQLAFQRGVTLGQPLEPDSELGRIVDSLAGKLMGAVREPKKPQVRFAIRPLLSHT
jgi:Flp pilus assembly CpaE family ATPase